MKKRFFFLLLPLIAAGWLATCKKEPEPVIIPEPPDYTVLPPATQTGANTFGCLVDGKVWVPRIPFGVITYRDKEASLKEKSGTGTGRIKCNLTDLEDRIEQNINIVFDTTKFLPINICNPNKYFKVIFTDFISGATYKSYPDRNDVNCIYLDKVDTVNNFISGRFTCIVHADTTPNSNKITITNGRFDLPYYPE